LNRNPYAPAVPCHRVIRSDGSVGGFARGTAAKARMLVREGIIIRRGRIDTERFGWKW
jgi:O6-methylguanine-DNA--protein-cysteine methyltransferase